MTLSRQEERVLRLRAEGLTIAEVAHRLGISSATVRGHSMSIYTKLGVTNLVAALAAMGWVNIPKEPA